MEIIKSRAHHIHSAVWYLPFSKKERWLVGESSSVYWKPKLYDKKQLKSPHNFFRYCNIWYFFNAEKKGKRERENKHSR